MSSLAITDEVLLAFADEVGDRDPIAVEGSRTRWTVGGSLDTNTRVISAPTGIVAYAASEMTVQVRAGTLVAELDHALAAEGQRCALPDRGGTVGGAVAVGENGCDTMTRGRVRDSVLQVRYVAADGQLVTGGGPVVKNVTGFSIPKLMTGSLGTLGLLAEVILRTNPIPAAQRWVAAAGVDPADVLDSLYRPASVLWDGTTTWVHLEGHAPDIEAESEMLRDLGGFVEVDGPPALPPNRWSLSAAQAASVDPAATGPFVAVIGVGLVNASRPAPHRESDPASQVVADRLKHNFDPTGRVNPGRRPGG